MPRTIDVADAIENINSLLRGSVNELVEYRRGVAAAAEIMLMQSGNYDGYLFLTKSEVLEGYTFGINFADGAEAFEGTDETRVRFTVPK